MRRQLLIFVALASTTTGHNVLESPPITKFGRWGEWEDCTPGLLVTGFQLKVESYRRRVDNTALNAIKLFCGNSIFKTLQEVSSSRGPFGRYQKPRYCSSYADGIQLKSQSYQGRNRDDVAAVNFKLICADGTELEGYRDASGHEYRESRYTEPQFCPAGQGICGIQTQVEYHQGPGDDSSLNNVRVKCCKVPVGVVPIESTTLPAQPTSTSTQAANEEETPVDAEHDTPATHATTTEIESTTEVVEITTELVEITPEATDATTQFVEITPEVVTDATTELVEITPTPEVVTDATTELVEITPEVVTDATTQLVEITPEATDATTEFVEITPTPEVVTDATTEVANNEVTSQASPVESYYGWLLNQNQ